MSGSYRALAVVFALTVSACSATQVVPEVTSTTRPAVITPTPSTTQPSFAGSAPAPEFPPGLDWLNTPTPLTLGDLRGKVVLLDFWTYGCINCIHIIPDLQRLEREFPDTLVVIGVHSAKFTNEASTENIRRIVQRYGLTHPVINDSDFAVWQAWGANAWPTIALIDPAGNVVGTMAGEGVYEVVEPVVSSLMVEFGAAGQLDRRAIDLSVERAPATLLSFPGKVLVDGDKLFIADTNHNRIVVSDLDGTVTEVIGGGERGYVDGYLRTALFSHPQGLAVSEDGATLFVADTGNHVVRQVDFSTGSVTTLAGTGRQGSYPPTGGRATETDLNSPWDLERDGRVLYIAMAGSHQIWAADLDGGTVEPVAGSASEGTRNGAAETAELAQPSGLALDGQRLYFADSESSAVRYLDFSSNEVGVVAGSDDGLFDFGDQDGVGTEARFQHPLGVAIDRGSVWVADTYNSKIKRIDPSTGEVVTLAGGRGWQDGPTPLFDEPGGIAASGGVLYVADTNNHSIRVVDEETGFASTLILSGLERYVTAREGSPVVNLPQAVVAEGSGEVVLDVALPEGFKVNEEAPSRFEWSVTGDIATIEATPGPIAGPTFPMVLPATFRRGSGTISIDMSLVYCEVERESICLLDQVRFVLPVVVGSGGSSIPVDYSVELPEGL